MKRLDYVDVARGIGIILVATGHSILFPMCGTLHIPLFFMLSGFLCSTDSLEGKEYGSLTVKRAKRLIMPYVFYSILLVLIYGVKELIRGSFTLPGILKAAGGCLYSTAVLYSNVSSQDNVHFLVAGNEGLWFLTSLVVASVLFYTIVFVVMKKQLNIWKMAVSAAVLIAAAYGLNRLVVYLPWGVDAACLGSVFMLLGFFIRNIKWEERYYGFFVLFIIPFVVLHGINGSANMAIHDYGKNMILFVITGMCGALFLFGVGKIFSMIPYVRNGLAYVGKNTLFILAFHTLTFGAISKVFGFAGDFYWMIQVVVSVGICLVAKEILVRIVKVPGKWL